MSDPDFTDPKVALRTNALGHRAALRSEVARQAAKQAQQHFLDEVAIADDQIVALYWPIRDEMDTRKLLSTLIDGGTSVCLPVVMGDDRPLIFRVWDGLSNLDVAGFGTMAPGPDAPTVEPDIILMPLAAYDSAGHRLGYGKGFYDRTIAGMDKRPQVIGFGFSVQQVDQVPAEAHDIPLNMMITELGVTRFG